MKIQRFNENNQELTLKKLKDITIYNQKLENILLDYLVWKNPDDVFDDDNKNEYYVTDFHFHNDDDFIINYKKDDYAYDDQFFVENIDELIKFINNSELIKATKKYNL